MSRLIRITVALCAIATCAAAQQMPRMSLDYSEPLFSTMAALNACGYGQDLADSLPVRAEIHAEIVRNAQSINAQNAIERMCKFYADHQQADGSRTLSQYVSLALNLGDAPSFTLRTKEAELPPDAAYVLGFVPLLQNFYITADLHKVYEHHKPEFDQLIQRYHEPVTNILVSTDIYLRQPLSGYVGRDFIVYLEPQAAPGQSNSRNYGENYYMVISPDSKGIRPEQIRHTYLHFVLDPLAMKRAKSIQKLAPLLNAVKTAPLDESYKQDISLLVTESLIRAVEARMVGGVKGPEPPRQEAVESAMREGFVLTRYFYERLVKFEKDEVGLRDAYSDWLFYIDVPQELKRAERIQFASTASPDPVRSSRKNTSMVELAERALTNQNTDAAINYANEALRVGEDAGRAYFVLARAATLQGKMLDAQAYYERTVQNSKDGRILAWSHIYLGRISDLKEDRPAALQHYQAALKTGDTSADVKAAAERGLEKPYEPPTRKPE